MKTEKYATRQPSEVATLVRASDIGKSHRLATVATRRTTFHFLAEMLRKCLVLAACVPTVCSAAEIPLSKSEVHGGLVVCLGGSESSTALWKAENVVCQCLVTSDAEVAALRKKIQQTGCEGRVSARLLNGKQLPYTDNLVNLILIEKPTLVSMDEVRRVLAPGGIGCGNGVNS